MPKLRTLSGSDVVKILEKFGFSAYSQKGSHIKLKRVLGDSVKQILTVPNHKELDPGTLKAIFRQSSRFVSEVELRPHFYSE